MRDGEEEHSVPLCGHSGSVDGLDDDTDYAFRVERSDGVSSTERLVRTGEVPGIIVNYLHPDDPEYEFSGRYLCSPSLLKLPDGSLLASMDLYAGGAPQNLTLIYVSHDGGRTWSHLTELFVLLGQAFSVRRQAVYVRLFNRIRGRAYRTLG